MYYNNFVTEFTLGNSLLSCSDIISTVSDNKLDRIIVADTMNVSALIPISEAIGDKLIFGVRLNLVETLEKNEKIYNIKIYPKNEKAMKLIYSYLSKSFLDEAFYRVPRISFQMLFSLLASSKDDFYISTGDFNNIFNYKNYERLISNILQLINKENLIFEINCIKSALFDKLNYKAIELGQKLNCKFILSNLCLHTKDNYNSFPVHYSINKNVIFNYLIPYNKDFYCKDFDKSFLNDLINRLNKRYNVKLTDLDFFEFPKTLYKWEKQSPKLPVLSLNPNKDLKDIVIFKLKEKIKSKTFNLEITQQELKEKYIPRLKYEFEIIEKLNFASYFLLVYDLVDWAKRNNILVGFGRGSAAGSLISYFLGITNVDPIKFDLLFERFINPDRLDLPDIDLDFMSSRRQEVVQYLYRKYGQTNVSGIINYSTLGAKSAIRNTARILGLSEDEYACSKLVPSEQGFSFSLQEAAEAVSDINNFSKKYPKCWAVSKDLEGKLRNYSVHAAGIIVANEPLIDYSVLETRDETQVINWDKEICEKQGLVKLDILGISNLDVIDNTLKLIKERHGIDFDINSIDLNNHYVLSLFAQGKTAGIFQFDGGSVKRMLRDMSKSAPLSFSDLVAANALNRPGPIQAGFVSQYISGKNGVLVDLDHPKLSKIVEETYNVFIYQEQVMKLAVDLCGYSLPEADNLRKIMGKKLPEKMALERDKFVEGAVKTSGLTKEKANEIFEKVEKFAKYGFNKSHSLSYSLLSYLCMFLKCYYPIEFYSSALTFVDSKKIQQIINEAKFFNIKVKDPHINLSSDKFIPLDSKNIISPLNKIKNISDKVIEPILEERKKDTFSSKEDFQKRVAKKYANKRVVENLEKVGAFDGFSDIVPIPLSERLINQHELMPDIFLNFIVPSKKIKTPIDYNLDIINLFDKATSEDYPKPFVGQDAKAMIIFDAPSQTEIKAGKITLTKAFNTTEYALHNADLLKRDFYWTSLCKRLKPKSGILNSADEKEFGDILREEIRIVDPQLIVCMGSMVSKFLIPNFKGSVSDRLGEVIYDKSLDTNIILGMNPNTIFFNPENEELLSELFIKVKGIL